MKTPSKRMKPAPARCASAGRRSAKPGDLLVFGRYPQTAAGEADGEPLVRQALAPQARVHAGTGQEVDGALFQLGFELTNAQGRPQAIDVGVQEMWAEAANVPGQYWSGFHFIDISGKDLEAIESWIGELGD